MPSRSRNTIKTKRSKAVFLSHLCGLIAAATSQAARAQEDDKERIAARPASMMMQPTPLLEPRINVAEEPRSAESASTANRLRGAAGNANSPGRSAAEGKTFTSKDVISGREALPLSSTDLGSLLKKSSSGLSSNVQAKTPIVSDPRIRGSRIGALAASGSHWVPARADLDTILSKFDSRQIKSVEIIPGPYSSLYGPGFSFTDVQLLGSPRYASGPQWHGSSDAEYKVNGNQFFGQQTLLTGAADWGARFNYAARDGGDYRAGGRLAIPSSYHSQEMILALGRDWKENSIELNVLRLDQTDVVFPGYVFDLDYLVTDGYEATHTSRDRGDLDLIETEAWYNRTRFDGNAQNPIKRPFFPVLDLMNYIGETNVDSMSTGYRQSFHIGDLESESFRFTFGHDLRFVKQELNEIASGNTLGLPIPYANRNSPIPRSYIANPGLFAEYLEKLGDTVEIRFGARADFASSDLSNDPENIPVGLDTFPATYSNIVGTDAYQRGFGLGSCFASLRYDPTDTWTTSLSGGYAERAPTLTELYAAQPFMLVLQNGLNNVTGDPTLAKERLFQFDIGAEYHDDWLKTGGRVFHSWGLDYITFENTLVNTVPPNGEVGQVSLRYVNTDLATILGGEWFGEFMPKNPVTPFANLRLVDGRDRTRNGNFATTNGDTFSASQKIAGRVRGEFNQGQVEASAEEPLPSMPPLESRLGLRLHDTSTQQAWSIDISARMVNKQTRVATSLLETATAGFTTWDTRGVFRVPKTKGAVVALGVENMFDRLYREHFDFRTASGLSIYQPGVNFYVSTSLAY
jgi:outer membrane receptor protein involved in Fe transport